MNGNHPEAKNIKGASGEVGRTTPRIEEQWQNKFLNKGTELGCGDLSLMIGTVSEILDKARKEAHQAGKKAGIDEAVEVISQRIRDGEDTILAIKNAERRDIIKALQDKK